MLDRDLIRTGTRRRRSCGGGGQPLLRTGSSDPAACQHTSSLLSPFSSFPTLAVVNMLLPTAILSFSAILLSSLFSLPGHASASPTASGSYRLVRSVSSGFLSPSDESVRSGRFGSASVSRVLRINYISSPSSYGYRRSYSQPEPLLCIGGNNECDFRPTSVQCYHKSPGNDRTDWQCESEEMNETLCFGEVHITCDRLVPEEVRWISGDRTPCRMLYTINRLETRLPLERKLQCSASHYDVPERHGRRLPGILSITLFLMVTGLVIFLVYIVYSAPDETMTIPKLPFEEKSSSDSSNSSTDSPIYPHLQKQINSQDSAPSPLLFAPPSSERSVRSLSR